MLGFIFSILGMEKVESKIIGRNFSSIFNNKVLGYSSEGIVRKHAPSVDGGRADTYLYGLLKEEWQDLDKGKKKTLSKLDKKLTGTKFFKKAKELLAEATYFNLKNIPDTASVDTWGSWDSLSHVRLLLAIENHLGKELEPDAVINISNLQDVARFISDN
jgi:acyl carrier protein